MAIKVNGTTVINDSRALNNISSVDATTAAAIGSAGVGGSSTLITDQATPSGSNGFTVDLTGGYQRYIIQVNDISLTGGLNGYARLRYTDSSGTAITGYQSHFGSMTELKGSGGSDYFDNYAYISYNYGLRTGVFEVIDPQGSGPTVTMGNLWTYRTDNDTVQGVYFVGALTRNYAGATDDVIVFADTTVTGGYYSVWGVS